MSSKYLVVEAEKLFSALRECPEGKFCETVTTTGDHDNCDKCWSDALEVRPLTAAEMFADRMVDELNRIMNGDGAGYEYIEQILVDMDNYAKDYLTTPEQGQGQEQEATYGPIKLCPHCQRAMTPNTICGHCGWSAEQEVQR